MTKTKNDHRRGGDAFAILPKVGAIGVQTRNGKVHVVTGATTPIDALKTATAHSRRTGENVQLVEKRPDGSIVKHGTVRPAPPAPVMRPAAASNTVRRIGGV